MRILKDLSSEIEGRHVIVAEDILDSGLTLKYLLKNLSSRNPASLEVATLLRKQTLAQAKIDCRYVGFECPDEFIVGYGLDFAERYRNLPYIGILKPELYERRRPASVGACEASTLDDEWRATRSARIPADRRGMASGKVSE